MSSDPLQRFPEPEDWAKRGQRAWDHEFNKANKTLLIWRIVAIGSVFFALISVIGWNRAAVRPAMVPYVVQINEESGRVDFRGVIQPGGLEVTPAMVRFYLERFITNTRSVSTDLVVTNRRLADAYFLATPRATVQLTEYIRGNNPIQLAQQEQRRDVRFERFEQLAEQLWRVEWTEEIRANGALIRTARASGTFGYVIGTPATPQEATQNPAGIFIDEFFFSIGATGVEGE